MKNPERFLYADEGGKHCNIDISCQPELKTAIRKLSNGNLSGYCRQVLIAHVRKELDKKNPKLER